MKQPIPEKLSVLQLPLNKSIFIFLICVLSLVACHSNEYPKPREYYRIDFPAKPSYKTVTSDCAFTFKADTNTRLIDQQETDETCQFQLYYPQYKAEIFFTYFKITEERPLEILLDEMHKLTYEHQVKAESIKSQTKEFPEDKKYVLSYRIQGNVASNNQFLITDSINHYVRAALYFRVAPNQDSLLPVIEHMNTEIDTLINSFKWTTY